MGLIIFTPGIPRSDLQKPQHIHAVDLMHTPAILQQKVVGGIDVFRQRQARAFGFFSAAGFVGNSDSTSVVWACTAMMAVEMSCMMRSAG